MASGLNTFPLILSIKEDGNLQGTTRSIESLLTAAAGRAGAAFEAAGRKANTSFSLDGARRDVERFAQSIATLNGQRSSAGSDAVRVTDRELSAALSAIGARRAAQTAAFAHAESEGNRLIGLERQRAAEAARYVSRDGGTAPFALDPRGAQQAAAAARAQAVEIEKIANAADRSRLSVERATTADNAYATASREAATAARARAVRLEEVAASEARIQAMLEQTTGAMNRQAGASRQLSTLRRQTLIYTASDVVSSLGTGANPLQILIQQGPQVAQAFAMGERGIRGMLDVLTPTRIAVGALAAATAVGAAAWLDYRGAVDKAKGLAQGIGAAAGLTAGQIVAAANAGATAANITTSSARELEAAYLATGKIGEQVLGRLIGITNDYAAATGVKATQAASELAAAFANPAAGADILNAKLGFLDQSGRVYIQTLLEQNRVTDAQTALLNALGPALEGAAQHTTALEQGFINIRNAAASAYEAIGRAIERAAGGGALLDRINDLTRKRDAGPTLGQRIIGVTPEAYRAQYQQQIDEARYQARQEQARADRGQANARAQSTGALVDKFTGRDARGKLRQQQAQIRQTLNDPLQSMPAQQRRETIDYYNALTRAIQSYIPEGKKQVQLAQIDAQIAATTSPARKAALAARREQINLAGKVITAADAEAIATANGTRASIGAARAADSHAAALRRRAEAFAQSQASALDKVQRIAEKFDKQPTLVDQSASAVREVDAIIAKYGKLSDATSKAIIEKGKLARVAAQAAPETAIGLATAELDDQMRITRMIAEGRQSEASALQDKLALLKRIGVELGKETAPQAKAIADYDAKRRELDRSNFDGRFANDGQAAAREADAIRMEIAGRQDIADLLRAQNDYEAEGQRLSEEQLAQLAQRQALEFNLTREKERQTALIDIQVRAAQDLQSALTEALTDPFKKGALDNLSDAFTQSRKRAVAQELSIKLVGDLGSKVHDALTRGSVPTREAADKLKKSAEDLSAAAAQLAAAPANDNGPTLNAASATPTAFGLPAPGSPAAAAGEIIVLAGSRYRNETIDPAGGDAPRFDARALAGLIPTISGPKSVGEKFGDAVDRFRIPLTYIASAVGGKAGAFISSVQNTRNFTDIGREISKEIGGPIGGAIGRGFQGLGIGTAVGTGLDALGLKNAKTGSAIGGAIGGAAFGPLGAIGGSLLGGVVSSLFYKAPKGSSGISVDKYGNIGAGSASGSSAATRGQATGLAGSVAESLAQIAQQLGGMVSGKTDVQIGTYKGEYRVNTTGGAVGGVKGSGAIGFGADEKAAIAYAISDALKDGVITGIRESTRRIIAAGGDLNKQLQKALEFESVFSELKSYNDPLGAATDAIDKRFAHLRQVFAEAGASTKEYADLEQLESIKRVEAIKAATRDITATLQALLDDLRFKGDSGLSLQTRESNALAAFNPLAAMVRAGSKVDQDVFADRARAVLDISRQLYGSTGTYFDQLSNITGLTSKAITNAGGTVQGMGGTPANDNAIMAQQIVQGFAAQTQALVIPQDRAAQFTQGQFTDAVRAAFVSPAADTGGVARISNNDVVTAIDSMSRNLASRFDLLIRVADSPPPVQVNLPEYDRREFRNATLRNA